MPDVLTIEHLSAGYGEAVVLSNVSLSPGGSTSTVRRASITRSRREASSTPTLGSAASSSMSAASSRSISPGSLMVIVYRDTTARSD